MIRFLLGNVLSSAALFSLVAGQDSCTDKMKKALLIPNYFNNATAGDLEVIYGDKAVKCGGEMQLLTTLSPLKPPTVKYDVQGQCTNVSVIAFDPDTLFLCPKRIYLHWFVTNIPANVMKDGYNKGKAGFAVSPYFPPGAPTGNHRYTFCVHCQKEYIKEERAMDNPLTTRMIVHPKTVVKKYGLQDALACTFYYLSVVNTPSNTSWTQAWRDSGNRDIVNTCKD